MPGLHISLGIIYRLFTLLESSFHQLDLELAQHASQPDTLHSFKLYSAAIHKLEKLNEAQSTGIEEADAAKQLASYLTLRGMPQQQIEYCRQAAAVLRKNVQELVSLEYTSRCKVNIPTQCKCLRTVTSGRKNLLFVRASRMMRDLLYNRLCPLLMLRGRPTLEEHSLAIMCIDHLRYRSS